MTERSDLERLRDIPDPIVGPASRALAPPLPSLLPSSPTRASVRRSRWLALFGALAYGAGMLAMMGVRSDIATAARIPLALGVLGPLAAAALAIRAAADTGLRGLANSADRIAILVGGPIVFLALAAALLGTDVRGDHWWFSTAMCLAGSLVLTTGPLALAVMAFRRSFATRARLRTVALGVGSGAVAVAALHLQCPIDEHLHLLFGHGAALVLGGVVGLLLARFTRA